MTERWKRSLDALGRAEPDASELRERALRGRRLPDPPRWKGSAMLAGVLSLGLAVASFTVLRAAFDQGPSTPSPAPSDVGASQLDPAAICDVPAYDPSVALLGDDFSSVFGAMGPREVPLDVLEARGTTASAMVGPAAEALRSYLASPEAVNAPSGGWRTIAESATEVIFAAPPVDGYSDWWVTRFTKNDGAWRPRGTELVDQHLTPAQAGHGMRLDWTGEVVLRDGGWTSALSLVNDRQDAWTSDDGEAFWGIAHVFDRSTGAQIGHPAETVGEWGPRAPLAARAAERIPLALGGSLADLEPGTTYDVVACVPGLGLASPVGSLHVVENDTARTPRVLNYPYTGVAMDALAVGQLVDAKGCLAIADHADDPHPTYVLWADGYSLVDRGEAGPVLIDAVGREVARLGDTVQLGGGGVELENAESATIGGVPDACTTGGGYFLTSGVVGG
jgi:hypothetical protein